MNIIPGLDNVNDDLIGTELSDTFQPGTSFDTATGDKATGNGGEDRLEIDYSSDTSGTGISSPGTIDGVIFSGDFAVSYTSIEQFDITGTDFADVLMGGSGSDTLRGGNGNDTISGGAGKDVLNGGQGNDDLSGGDGVDFYIVDSRRDRVTENAGEGTDTVISTVNYALPQNVENLVLNQNGPAGRGSGNDLKNRITGNSLNNHLSGGAGFDNLRGLDGNDNLFGGDDNDSLLGGNGNDILQGNNGLDRLTGGSGRDRFRFSSNNEGRDTIVDFEVGTDLIQISRSGFNLSFSTRIPQESFVLGSKPLDANDFFMYDKASGELIFDSNGNASGGRKVIASLGSGVDLTRTAIRLLG